MAAKSPKDATPVEPVEAAPETSADAEGQPAAPPPERQRRGLSFLGPILLPAAMVRVAAGLLILGSMTAGTFFVVTDVLAPRLGGAPGPTAAGTAVSPATEGGSELPGEQYLVDEMVINPSGTQGKRFLRLGIALETRDGERVIAELDSRKPQVRDLFIREFSSRSLEELTDPTVREEIRVACVDRINGFLVSGSVNNLYYTDYVLQ
ncbi:MAG: flagellar basal body-associated FliL family protein [Candidatus Eisenbacteria bacterium]